jgi:hypothetical protein
MSTGHLSGLQTSMIWVLLLALPGVLGLPAHPYRHAALRRSAPLRTLAQGPPASYLEQPLDQFDATLRRTWRQRYFVNASFFNGDGPVFLCVGGCPVGWEIDGRAAGCVCACVNTAARLTCCGARVLHQTSCIYRRRSRGRNPNPYPAASPRRASLEAWISDARLKS